MITLRWSKFGEGWRASYKQFMLFTATPQKWNRQYGKPYFKIIHTETYNIIYSDNLQVLIKHADNYKAKK